MHTESRLAKLAWPGRVLFVIQTDGLENASQEWTRNRVFAKIRELRDRGWEFLFLGVNEDAYIQGEQLGAAAGNVVAHGHSRAGMETALRNTSAATTRFRNGNGLADDLFLPEERAEAERTRSDRPRR